MSKSKIHSCSIQFFDYDPRLFMCCGFLFLEIIHGVSIHCSINFVFCIVIRIEETKLVCANSSKCILG